MTSSPLHIVLGDSAADSLREACATLGLPGRVFAIPDDLSHGPLNDGRARAAYFREHIYSHGGDPGVPDDMFQSWRDLAYVVSADKPTAVVIWTSDAISDAIFLRMACWELGAFEGSIECVNTSEDSWHGVGVNNPGQLRAHYERRVALSKAEREALAAAFAAMRERSEGLRVHRDGQIAFVGSDHFDDYVLSFVARDWKRAALVVGNCIVHGDDHDAIGDVFFEWRLRQLINSGRVQAQGDLSHMRGYHKRLA